MLVAESMPPTSEQLPLLGIYYAVTIGIVSFSTSMAVITLNINNKGDNGKEVPKIVKIIYFDYLAKYLNIKLSHRTKIRSFSIISSTGEIFNKKLLNNHSFKKEKKYANVANLKKSNSNLKVYDMHSQITNNKKIINNVNTSNYVVESSLTCKEKQIKKADMRKHSSTDNDMLLLGEEENKKSKKLIERVNLEVEKSNCVAQKEENSLSDALESSSLFQSPKESILPTSISNYDNVNSKKINSSNYKNLILNRNAQLYNFRSDKYDTIYIKQATSANPKVINYTPNKADIELYQLTCLADRSNSSCPICQNSQCECNYVVNNNNNNNKSTHFLKNNYIINNNSVDSSNYPIRNFAKNRSCVDVVNVGNDEPIWTLKQDQVTSYDQIHKYKHSNRHNKQARHQRSSPKRKHSSFDSIIEEILPYKNNKREIAVDEVATHKNSHKGEFLKDLEKLLARQFEPLIGAILKTVERNDKSQDEKERLEVMQSEWADVAMISDHILCYFFCILTIVSCLLIFFNSPHVLLQW
jgi:hypothetical protein